MEGLRRNVADREFQVIGGGAVGLAIARKLSARDGTSTVLIERNGGVGMETSSRNSEVGALIFLQRFTICSFDLPCYLSNSR